MPLSEETKTLIQKYQVTISDDDDSYLDLDTSLDPIEDGKYRLGIERDGLKTTDEKVIEVKDQKIVKNENLYLPSADLSSSPGVTIAIFQENPSVKKRVFIISSLKTHEISIKDIKGIMLTI